MSSPPLVQVATAYSVSDALVVQSMLRAYGIAAHAFDLGTANADPGLMIAIGGIRIFVNEADAHEAHAMIWRDRDESPLRRPFSDTVPLNAIAALLLALLGVPAPARIPLQR